MTSSDALDTNLLRSKPGGKNAAPGSDTSPGGFPRKKILKAAAYTVFFLWSLATFTVLKIPDSVVANSLLNAMNQSTPYQWQAEKIGVSFFPLPHLKMEKLSLDPKFPGAGPALFLDEVRVYPNPFSLLPIGGAPAFGGTFRAEAYKATLKGSFGAGKDMFVRLESDSIDLGKLAPLASQVDLKGQVTELYFRAYLPGQRVGSTDGELRLHAKNLKLDPGSLNLPLPLPLLDLGEADVVGTITKGQVKFEKFKVGGKGSSVELQIPNGTVNLSDVSFNTRYDLHLLLKVSPSIEQAVPGLGGMIGSMSTSKPDGFYAMKLQGSLLAPGMPTKE
jgi:type II secretion system protein N